MTSQLFYPVTHAYSSPNWNGRFLVDTLFELQAFYKPCDGNGTPALRDYLLRRCPRYLRASYPLKLNKKHVALIWSPLTGFLNRTESGKHLMAQWESEEIGKMTPCSSPSLGSWANSMPDSGSSMWWAWSSRSMAENRMLSSMDSWDYCWVFKESPILMIQVVICLKRLWI